MPGNKLFPMPQEPLTAIEAKGTKIPAFAINGYHVLTALQLINSPEEHVVLGALGALDCFITKDEEFGVDFLLRNGFLDCIGFILDMSTPITRFCLKILAKMAKHEDMIMEMQQHREYIPPLVNIFIDCEDLVILEYTSYILGKICTTPSASKLLCRPEFITFVFYTIATTMDIDLKKNCLQCLFCITKCYFARDLVSQNEIFRLEILNLMLKGPFPILRPTILDILEVISTWNVFAVQEQLYETRTVNYLLTVLMEPEWTWLQNRCLDIIHNIINYNPCMINTVESKELMDFVNYATEAQGSHALACTSLLVDFATIESTIQALYDLHYPEQLLHFFDANCDLVNVKICQALSAMCCNCQVAKNIGTPKLFKELGKIMGRHYLPWDPYREAPLLPIHTMVTTNPRIVLQIYKQDLLRHLHEAILHRYELGKRAFSALIDILYVTFHNKTLQTCALRESTFDALLALIDDENSTIAEKSLHIVQECLLQDECRDWFVEKCGCELIIMMLSKSDSTLADKLIGFVLNNVKYKSLARGYLYCGLVPILSQYRNNDKLNAICTRIIDIMYSYELSVKFHQKDFLSIGDITPNGFYVHVGSKPSFFPVAVERNVEKLKQSNTVIVANFTPAHRKIVPVRQSSKRNGPISKKYITFDPKKQIGKYKYPINDDYSNPPDHFLWKYLEEISPLINEEDDPLERIEILANFVYTVFSGFQNNEKEDDDDYNSDEDDKNDDEGQDKDYDLDSYKDDDKDDDKEENKDDDMENDEENNNDCLNKHQYELHINDLKLKFKSNYIPLGHIRIGTKMERAILFKVLGDRVGVPNALYRNSHNCYWNEVYSTGIIQNNSYEDFPQNFESYVVDLMNNIGELMPKNGKDAMVYCKLHIPKNTVNDAEHIVQSIFSHKNLGTSSEVFNFTF